MDKGIAIIPVFMRGRCL